MPELREAIADALADLDAGIAVRRRGGLIGAADYGLLLGGKAKIDRVRTIVAAMQADEQALLTEREAASKASLAKTISTLLIASGVAIGMVLLSFLLLLRERRNQRVQAELARYNRLMIESTGDGMYGVDLDGNCTFLNVAGEKILGRTAADVIGRNMHELTHHTRADGTPYPGVECPIYRAFRTGVGGRCTDELFWRGDGTSFPVEYSAYPIRNDESEVEGAVVTFTDISERVRLDREIADSGERFSTLADNMAQLAWMADGLGSIFWYNRRWFEYTGTTLEQMRGDGWKIAHHPRPRRPRLGQISREDRQR